MEKQDVREYGRAEYLKGLRTACELAEDHGVEWLKGYVTGVAVRMNAEIAASQEKEN